MNIISIHSHQFYTNMGAKSKLMSLLVNYVINILKKLKKNIVINLNILIKQYGVLMMN